MKGITMFKKLFNKRNQQTITQRESQQVALDVLRTMYADDGWMQLHLDRMQSALTATV
jgi:hypothetical protein